MENQDPSASSLFALTPGTSPRAFSKTILVTYVCMGFFGLILLATAFFDTYQALTSRQPLLFLVGVAPLGLGIGFIYVILGLRGRRNWARYAALSFWMLCLIGTAITIVRHGLHPEPAPGPFRYSNADQLAGARVSALALPYFLALVESSAIYCLLRRAKVVNQFKASGERV